MKYTDIAFPKEEQSQLSTQDRIITTRVSDDYSKYKAGDTVKTPWGDVYTVKDKSVFSDIKEHPYYDFLTPEQLDVIKQYKRFAVLELIRDKMKKKASAALYTYVPKKNTLDTDGLYGPWGDSEENLVRRYGPRANATTKQQVLDWLERIDPGRSRSLSVLTEPVPDTASDRLKAFADSHQLVKLPSVQTLIAAGLVEPEFYKNIGGKKMYKRKRISYRPIDWNQPNNGLLFKKIPHYLLIANKAIPPEYLEKQATSERSIKTPEDLDNLYKKFKYRILNQKTGRPYFNTNKDTFDSWQLLTVAQMLKHKIGICFDTAALNDYFLSKWNIPHENLFAVTKRSLGDEYDEDPTHTFTVYKDKDKWKWLEGSWEPFKNNGWQFDNKEDLIRAITKQLANSAGTTNSVGYIKKYPNPGVDMPAFFHNLKLQGALDPVYEEEPDHQYKQAASYLYHASPKALKLLAGITTRHGETGSVFASPSKAHASLFVLDRRAIVDAIEKQLGKNHIKLNNISYGQWKNAPSDQALDTADVYVDTAEKFEPFSGEQEGYLYYIDTKPYLDKIKKWKHDNGDRELLIEGDVVPDKVEKLKLRYNVLPGKAP